MFNKIINIIIVVAITMILALGITGCSAIEEGNNQAQTSDISNSSVTKEETNPINITTEASEKLKDFIANGDYPEDILLRIDTVKGYG